MSRQYPHSDKIQPRFAAWLWSIGGDADPNFKTWAPRLWGCEFRSWIETCKRRAFEMGMGVQDTALSAYYRDKQLQVIDHDAFTEACWIVADDHRAQLARRVPPCPVPLPAIPPPPC